MKPHTFDFGVQLRLPEGTTAGAGLVFGWIDPDNHHRVVLDPAAGAIRVVRVASGRESVVAEKAATIPRGEWLILEIEVEGGRVEVQFQDAAEKRPELEFAIDGVTAPASALGIVVLRNGAAEFLGFEIEDEGRGS